MYKIDRRGEGGPGGSKNRSLGNYRTGLEAGHCGNMTYFIHVLNIYEMHVQN